MRFPFPARRGPLACLTLLLASCAGQPDSERSHSEVIERGIPEAPSYHNIDFVGHHYSPASLASALQQQHRWLRDKTVSFSEPTEPIRLTEVMRWFKQQGVNISSSLPLNTVWYSGTGVNRVSAYTALYSLFGTKGFDLVIDDDTRSVEIVPMRSHTWYITTPETLGSLGISGESTDAAESSGGGGGDSGGGGEGGGGSGFSGISNSSSESSSSELTTTDSFWNGVRNEITARLTLTMPVAEAPPQQATPATPDAAAANPRFAITQARSEVAEGSNDMYREVQVGRVSVNPNAGSITVQAPHFLIPSLDRYFTRLGVQNNSLISIKGLIVFVSSRDSSREGFDFSGFANFAREYGVVATNNALGGITFSPATSGAVAAVSATNGVGTNLGVIKDNNMLRIFSSYLESNGLIKTLQRPQMSSTHGKPAVFSSFDRDYVSLVSETAAAGNDGNAAVARQNEIVPFSFGTSLRVLPFFDPDEDLVRAQISLTQVLQSGVRTIAQVVGGADGGVDTIQTDIPLDRRINVSGDVILPSGSLIIFGGQTVSTNTDSSSGMTGLRRIPLLKPFFNQASKDNTEALYYVALQVDVQRREGRNTSLVSRRD